MTPFMHRLVAVLSLSAFAAGCGGGDGPTDPVPAPEPMGTTTLSVAFEYIAAIADCDGVEGAGDFQFEVRFGPGDPAATDLVYSETVNLHAGQRTGDLPNLLRTVDALDGEALSIGFKATELDRTIFGDEYADERLDRAFGSMTFVYSHGTWSNLGDRSITLGNGQCEVRLSWRAGEFP